MQILDCSRSAGRRITDHGSEFRLVPLMRASDLARTVVFHFSAGDFVGEHQAGARQLLLVMRGSGWVSGSDGVRQAITEDFAAVLEPGEIHAAGSETGMVAVVVEGDFNTE